MKEGELYLSKYKILKVYKETLESCVFLAEHIQLNSYWIIKQLNGVNDETYREVEVLKGVNHPGIPLIIDVILEENSLVIIREYVEGETLNDYSTNGLSQAEIVSIGLKICHILRFLHEDLRCPLIFRDIKPGNIIISKNGDLKLIDFGIARFYKEDKGRDTTYLGTKGFAAAEQYGKGQSDVRTDVFGLGATLYYLLTKSDLGKPPYKIRAINKFRQDIDISFENIIIKACEINKNNRYQSIKEFEKALMKLVNNEMNIDWHNKLAKLNKNIISISSLKSGSGSSYLALRIAKYLSSQSLAVAIIDISETKELLSLEFQEEASVINKLVSYGGVTIISSQDMMTSLGVNIHERLIDIDYIIIDFGNAAKDKCLELKEFIQDSKLYTELVVSRVSPWEVESFEEYILSQNYDEEQLIIINACSKVRYKAISDSLEDVDCYYLTYEPFECLDRDDVFSKNLLERIGGDFDWSKKESFLNPKFFKTKLLNKIKS